MSIDQVLDSLDDLLDKAWSLPLTGGKCMVDAEKVRDMIDDIRINMPSEIKQAKAIVADRNEILSGAKREGEQIIRKAEERAKALIAHEEIIRISQSKASDIMSQAQVKSKEMRNAAADFSDNVLKTSEETLEKALEDVRATRHVLRTKGK